MEESIMAAACTRIQLTVLHLDRNDYYGGLWSSFNLQGVETWFDQTNSCENEVVEYELQDAPSNSSFVPFHYERTIKQAQYETVIKAEKEKPQEPPNETEGEQNVEEANKSHEKSEQWTYEKFRAEWRKFSIDLNPKTLLAQGSLVDLLVQSGVGRYAEFKLVDRLLSQLDDTLTSVPTSRSDVFQSNLISMMDKRKLMKFLTYCMQFNADANELTEMGTFDDVLESHGLSVLVRQLVIAISGVNPKQTSPLAGINALGIVLRSVGRFGNSPYLWTQFGSGELPQCFCRLCAVFGGIYCLNRSIQGYFVDHESKRCTSVMTEGKVIKCKYVICHRDYVNNANDNHESCIHRAILITDKSILPHSEDHISMLNLEGIQIVEVASCGSVCPKGLYVVHMTCDLRKQTQQNSGNVFEPVMSRLYGQTDSPNILWRSSFCYEYCATEDDSLPTNLIITNSPDATKNYQSAVTNVRNLFSKHWPDKEFLPPVPEQIQPDDDEIITEQICVEENASADNPDVNNDNACVEKPVST